MGTKSLRGTAARVVLSVVGLGGTRCWIDQMEKLNISYVSIFALSNCIVVHLQKLLLYLQSCWAEIHLLHNHAFILV